MGKPLAWIVEDDPMLGQIFCKTLENDFEIELITNGLQAQLRLEAVTPESAPLLIMLDINLPGVSGRKIYENIHGHMNDNPALANIHVIICSADSQATELVRDGADLALLKPVSPLQLRQLAGRILSGAD